MDIIAPVKLIIAGNHDFTLDVPVFKQKIAEANRLIGENLEESLVKNEFGDYGGARELLQQAKEQNIMLLNQGSHQITLQNGTVLSIYASPYTPSTGGEWGFQYSNMHNFNIPKGTDIVITHGPPRGIMDMTADKKRIGCPQLFAAIAKSQPRIHCFGHVHNGWGAKLVTWRPIISDNPSHFSDIDNEKSSVIETLSSLKKSEFESAEERQRRNENVRHWKKQNCYQTSHCSDDDMPLGDGQTLFVNASTKGDTELNHLPWLVEFDLGRDIDVGTY